MNVEVEAAQTLSERVKLEMSPEEFAVIYLLAYYHLGGAGPLRESVERGMENALALLDTNTRARFVNAKAKDSGYEYIIDTVEAAFA